MNLKLSDNTVEPYDKDKVVFDDIVNKNLNSVYGFIYHLTNDHDLSDDITQETFVKIWKNIKKYNPTQNLKSWIFVIARNTTIDWLRKKKNISFSSFEDEEGKNFFEDSLVSDELLADEIFSNKEEIDLLKKEIEKLSPIYKEVLFLHYNEGLDFQEIADILKKSINTVKSQNRRALVDLKKRLSK